jgi:hypothetical protein
MTYYSKYPIKELVQYAKEELSNLGRFSMLPIKLKAVRSRMSHQLPVFPEDLLVLGLRHLRMVARRRPIKQGR